MKKNVLLGAAVAGLFATSAFAGKPMKGVTTEEACTAKKGTWMADKKECDASCKGKSSHSSKSTAKAAPAAPAEAAPAAPAPTTTPAN